MEDGEAEAEATAEDGWLSILIATSSPSIAQWANIVQNLLCHANSAKGKSFERTENKLSFIVVFLATFSPLIAQWANIVQNLLCHANSAKGKSSIPHLKGLKIKLSFIVVFLTTFSPSIAQ